MPAPVAPPLAKWRTVTVYIDCPRYGCGGGVEGSDGSYMLAADNMSELRPATTMDCPECGQEFRIPRQPFVALGLVR